MTASIQVQNMSRVEYLEHIRAVKRRLGYQVDPKPVNIAKLLEDRATAEAEGIKLKTNIAHQEAVRIAERKQRKRDENARYRTKLRATVMQSKSQPELFDTALRRIEKSKCYSWQGGHFKLRGASVVPVVQWIVCDHYGIIPENLLSSRRLSFIVKPRQMAMYLARELSNQTYVSLPLIGQMFGGYDHTTVLHAVQKFEKLIASDGVIADEVDVIRQKVLARIQEPAQ